MSSIHGAEEKAKLERLVNEGVTVLQEVEDPNRIKRYCKSSSRRIRYQTCFD